MSRRSSSGVRRHDRGRRRACARALGTAIALPASTRLANRRQWDVRLPRPAPSSPDPSRRSGRGSIVPSDQASIVARSDGDRLLPRWRISRPGRRLVPCEPPASYVELKIVLDGLGRASHGTRAGNPAAGPAHSAVGLAPRETTPAPVPPDRGPARSVERARGRRHARLAGAGRSRRGSRARTRRCRPAASVERTRTGVRIVARSGTPFRGTPGPRPATMSRK